MGEPTLSILLPTIGRPSLARTLASIRAQRLIPGDEVLLAVDGGAAESRAMWTAAALPGQAGDVAGGPHGDWGHTPRNVVMPFARGDYILSIDDDDALEPGAFDMIRAALAENPSRPHLFRMRYHGRLLWEDRAVRLTNFSTQQIVVPNDPAKLGVWGNRYEGDFDFMTSTLALYPRDALVWREEVIACYRDGVLP